MKSRGRRWLGWIIGAVVLALVFIHLSHSPEWRDFAWGRLGSLLVHVRLRLLVPAIALSYFTYLIRAYRWKFFVDPIKSCRTSVLFNAQILGFSAIYLAGRAGEVVRPAWIARAENLPFTSQLAVWVLERVFDSISLIVLFALALYFSPLQAGHGRSLTMVRRMHEGALGVLALSAAAVVCLVVYRMHSERLLGWLDRAAAHAPAKLRSHLQSFARSFSSGLNVVRDPWDFSASVACSVLLWVVNVTVLWLVFRSVGGPLADFGWWPSGMVTFMACLGLAVQLPGVGGGYQVATLLSLRDIFRVPSAAAASSAILTWFAVMAPCVALGLILIVASGLSVRRIRNVVQEEESEVAAPGDVAGR